MQPNPGKVEKLGEEAQKKAIQWNVEGISHQEIADRLNSEYNSGLNADNVFDFCKRKRNKSIQMLKDDKGLQTQLVQKYFDTIDQIRKINEEMWKLFYEIRKDPELLDKSIDCPHCQKKVKLKVTNYGPLLKAADVILSQIKHVDDLLGKMHKKQLNITYNILDLSKKLQIAIPNILENLEKRGIVKVNKSKLKQVYLN
jgi:hypothetical protein